MDDFKIIIYIILAILYFFVTNFKKIRQKRNEQKSDATKPELPSVNLEDILKQHLPKTETLNNTKGYDSKLTPEIKGRKSFNLERTEIKALSLERKEEAGIARQRAKLAEEKQKFTDRPKPLIAHPIAALLQNPASARNAIILSEVLKRKEY